MANVEFTTEELASEEWRPVVGYEGRYEVSSLGRVKSLSWHGGSGSSVMRPTMSRSDKRGYLRVTLAGGRTRSVHSMVAEAFIGPRPAATDGYRIEVNHKDGVKSNCRFSNLEYATQLANMQHAAATGLMPTGDRSGARLHPERRARGLRNGSYTHPESKPRGDRSPSRMHPERLARGEKNGRAKLSAENVKAILARLSNGETHRALGEAFGVSHNRIGCIARGKSWAHITRSSTAP